MPAFLVAAAPSDRVSRVGKTDMAVVFAADAADARAMAKSRFAADGDSSWDSATTTQVSAGADLQDWRMRVRVAPPGGGPDIADVTFTGLASAAPDDFGTGLVPLLNATASIAAALYTAATNILTVAAIADNLGDHTVVVDLLPPVVGHLGPVAVPGGVVLIVHEGAAGAALDVTLAADAFVVPNLLAVGKRVL